MRRHLFLAICFATQSSFAGIGGSSGGTSHSLNGKYVTTEICDQDFGVCRKVTYKVRPPLQDSELSRTPCNLPNSVNFLENPCEIDYRIPRWLIELNRAFENHSVEIVEE